MSSRFQLSPTALSQNKSLHFNFTISQPYTVLLASLCLYTSQTQRVKTLSCLSKMHHAHAELWDTSMKNSPLFNKHSARQNKPLEHPVIKIAGRESSVLIFAVAGFKAPRLSSLGFLVFFFPLPRSWNFFFQFFKRSCRGLPFGQKNLKSLNIQVF